MIRAYAFPWYFWVALAASALLSSCASCVRYEPGLCEVDHELKLCRRCVEHKK